MSFTLAHAARHARRGHSSSSSSSGGTAKLHKVDSCKAVTEGTKKVLIIKQWHLAPKTVTKGFKEKYPQERNQTAIYDALSDDIKKKKVQLVVAEGCESGTEINSKFTTAYNGWDYSELHKVAQTKGYNKILSHIPLKLEARYDDGIHTMCGDSDKLIQEGNLRLSNLRGWMGFWTRLHETYPDDKGKMYGDAAADLLKVPRTTPVPQLLSKIHDEMITDLGALRKSFADRNDAFVKTLNQSEFEVAAVVIGGLHADDLKNKVQAAGLACDVLEPPGYQREDEQLLDEFEKAINSKSTNP
jgi:hypothetical protein